MDPAAAEHGRRVCPRHGTVLNPLGHCVICRRDEVDVAADPSGARGAITALVLLALALAAVVVYRGSAAPKGPPPAPPVVEAAAAPDPPPAEEDLEAKQQEARAAQKAREIEAQKAAVEKEIQRVPIRVYTTRQCDLCRTATEFLKGKGLAHTEIDVDESAEGLAALGALNPKRSVPTIVVGDEVIVGFGPGAVMVALHRAAARQAR